jgi:hypothetical protein
MNIERWLSRNLERDVDEKLRATIGRQLQQDWCTDEMRQHLHGVLRKLDRREFERREQAWQDAKATWFTPTDDTETRQWTMAGYFRAAARAAGVAGRRVESLTG